MAFHTLLISVGQANFDWVVKTAADFAIEKARSQKDGVDNLTWGTFVKNSVSGNAMSEDNDSKMIKGEKKTIKKLAKNEWV
jgi:hypothetical protein